MNAMVECRAVRKSMAGRPVLDGVSLRLRPGEVCGLIGAASSGKSVLLKLLCGLLVPDAGEVAIAGEPLRFDSPDELQRARANTGVCFQNNALFDFMTVFENVCFPIERQQRMNVGERVDRVMATLRAVGLMGSENKFPSELSGGMRKRAALARALVASPPLLLCDEPTAGLDPVTTARIYELLETERERTQATLLLVSSDVDGLRSFVPRLVMLHQGKVRYDGASSAVLHSDDEVARQFVSGALEPAP